MESFKFMEKDEAILLAQELFKEYFLTDPSSLLYQIAIKIKKEIYGSLYTPYHEDSNDDKFVDVCYVDGDGFAN